MARSTLLLVWACVLAVAAGGTALGAPPAQPTARLLVPAYFYPAGDGLRAWDRLIAASDKVPIVAIANPASGPGKQADDNYRDVLARARRSKLSLIGYVDLGYAKRPAQGVKADVDQWLALYPGVLDGIFFDQQPSGAEQVPFVAECFAHARKRIKEARIVSNPGTVCAPEYFDAPGNSIICIHENKDGVDAYNPPPWASRFGSDRIAVLLYDVPGGDAWARSLRELSRKRAGYVYVTDHSGANPWDRLPSYWDQEVAAVAAENGRVTPAR